jgi:hypothetical protein
MGMDSYRIPTVSLNPNQKEKDMKIEVTFYNFVDAFRNHGRENSFSYEAKRALFNYLEELEEDCGMDIELDVIALDCDYCEYGNATEAAREYDCEEETEEYCLNWLYERTQVIPFNSGVIIQSF